MRGQVHAQPLGQVHGRGGGLPLPVGVLQRTAGNAAVARVMAARSAVQRTVDEDERPARLATHGSWERQKVWSRASYGAHTPRTGGTSVKVTLGPGMRAPGSTYAGSRPRRDACTIVDELNAQCGWERWIKGHLWNDNLGGPGVSENLTPMTGRTNGRFNSDFEEPLKRMLDACASQARSVPGHPVWYGVEFDVRKDGAFDDVPDPADRATFRKISKGVVAEGFEYSAHYVEKDKASGATARVGAAPRGFPAEID